MVNIKEFIRRAGLKGQDDLAERLGVKTSAVSAWSSGKRTPTYEMCERLLELGMTVEELFGKPYQSSAKVEGNMDRMVQASLIRLLENAKFQK